MSRSSGFRPISQRLWNLKSCAMWQLSVSSQCVILDASDILQIGMQALPPGSKLNLVGRISGKIMQNRLMHKLV